MPGGPSSQQLLPNGCLPLLDGPQGVLGLTFLCRQGPARGPRTPLSAPRPCFLGPHLNSRSLTSQMSRAWAGPSNTRARKWGVSGQTAKGGQPDPHWPGPGRAGSEAGLEAQGGSGTCGGGSWSQAHVRRVAVWPSLPRAPLSTNMGNEGTRNVGASRGVKAQAGRWPGPGRGQSRQAPQSRRFQALVLSLNGRPGAWPWVPAERRDFTATARGSGGQAGGRRLSRNPRSCFNNLFQN